MFEEDPEDLFDAVFTQDVVDKLSASLHLTEQALKHSPNDANLNFLYGKYLLECDTSDTAAPRAMQYLTRAVTLRPGWADAHYWQGRAFLVAHMRDQAIHSFRKALLIDPNNLQTLSALAMTLVYLNRYDEATQVAYRMITVNPFEVSSHFALGVSLLTSAQIRTAVTEFKAVLDLEPAFVEANYFIALAALLIPDTKLFEMHYQELKAQAHYLAEVLHDISDGSRPETIPLSVDVVRELIRRVV